MRPKKTPLLETQDPTFLLLLLRDSGRSRSLPTSRHRTCGPKQPRGPVTNFLALSPRATGKRFGSARTRPQRIAPRRYARAHAPCTHQRPTTNDATCGPPVWLTGRLKNGGTRSVRSPLKRTPLLATPITTPLQGGRSERPRPFCFLNYFAIQGRLELLDSAGFGVDSGFSLPAQADHDTRLAS